MKKKFFAFCLTLVMIVSIFGTSVLATSGEFDDVSEEEWFYEDVMICKAMDFVRGKSNNIFDPNGNITEAEAITIVSRFVTFIRDENTDFAASNIWYEPYVEYAEEIGLISYHSYIDYNRNITRYDAAKLLLFALKETEWEILNDINTLPDTEDEDILFLYRCGILTGKDEYGTFDPYNYLSRAEMCCMLNRIYFNQLRLKFELKGYSYLNVKNRIVEEKNYGGIFTNSETYKLDEGIREKLYSEIIDYGDNCAFYVVTLDGKLSIGYNIDTKFHSASTVKQPYTLYVYKELERGNGDFDDELTYLSKHDCGGTPMYIQKSKYGTKYTLDDVLFHTINWSDNAGYYMLQERFGINGYNTFLKSIGCSKMKLSNSVRWGWIYPREMALIWNETYDFMNNSEYGQMYFDLLLNARFNFIKDAHLAEYGRVDYQIAHKSGFNDNGRHDTAIVLHDEPYIIVICTVPNGREKEFINNVAVLLDEAVKDYANMN